MSKSNFLNNLSLTARLQTDSLQIAMLYNCELSNKITEEGQKNLKEIVEPLLTRQEKIGDTIFPVTYGPNGIVIVIVDYPILFK